MAESIQDRKKRAAAAEPSLTPAFPYEIFIDLTSFCNHACVFCSNSRVKEKAMMKPQMVEKVLREAYAAGTRDIGVYATGESFLVENLAQYIKDAKDMGYNYIFITTNGALVTPEKAKAVIDAGLDSIKFSINAGTRESYKKVHGKDDFDKVIAHLKWISDYRKSSGKKFRIYVTTVYTNAIKEEIELLKSIITPYIDEWDPHLLTNQCGNKQDNNDLGEIEKGNFRGRGKSKICFQPFKGFTVTPEGYVSACVIDYQRYLIVGDANKNTLSEIWNSPLYQAFRKQHMDADLKGLVCFNCVNNTDDPVTPLMEQYCARFK